MSPAPRKTRLYLDRVKERHTSHWDEDVLTRAQRDRLYEEANRRVRHGKRRQFAWISFWLALLCLYPTLMHWIARALSL